MPGAPARGRAGGIDHAPASPPLRRSPAFLLVFALANAGGVIAYLPLLTLLLPLRVEAVAGEARLGLLTATVIAGALAASASNIAFGWLSDRSVARGGGRRRWAAVGLAGVALGCALVALASSPVALVIAVAAFQTGVNALLAPLLAIMADEIPDAQKGVAGGLLALGTPVASAVSAVIVGVGALGPAAGFALAPLACAACVAPLLATRRPPPGDVAARPVDRSGARDLALAWAARLLVQVAGNVLSLYLLYYVESIMPGASPDALATRIGRLLTIAYLLALPIAVAAGRLSDRTGRRKPFLLAAAGVAAAGLVGLALARDWSGGAAAFAAYAVGSAVFLALHAGFAMQLLPSARHRGRDLGVLNLANTLPALAGPLLAWALATPSDFTALMLALAGLTIGGGLLILAAQGRQ